jgi:signal transduction histidine kinase
MIWARSLKAQLWLGLLALLTVVGVAAALMSYVYTLAETETFLDNQLRQVAVNIEHAGPATAPAPDAAPPHDAEDDLNVQIWNRDGKPLRTTSAGHDIARQLHGGLADTHTDKIDWRTFTAITDTQTIQVSQQASVRQELAQDAALRILIPLGIVMPLAWLLLGFLINRVLGGLENHVYKLAHAKPGEPAKIADVPAELVPMVVAMNDVFTRQQQSLAVQKRFVADAAHELRTPLTALQLQVANLRQAGAGGPAQERIEELDRGIRRASSMAQQLLKLARFQSEDAAKQVIAVDLATEVRTVVADLLPIADHRCQDIGLVSADAVSIKGDPADLRILVGTLLENAIRHTPSGGTIDISVRQNNDGAWLEVADTGPGIPEGQLHRVFEPFYRAAAPSVEGSGLGLSIASRIAERHGAHIELVNRTDRQGLCARVRFPRHEMVTAS